MNGIVLLDKPIGCTSNAALQEVKKIFRARKAGHTGSLDPMASGLLPICLGEATKISAFLLDADKRYVLTARFGQRTTTGDAEGDVVETRATDGLSEQRIAAALADFRGEQDQIPPMYSAVKRGGQPLYKLARQGIEVEREPRRITVYEYEVTGGGGDEYRFSLYCSKGTYVRTLIEDLGEKLGCGAHVCALRRTGVGVFEAPEYPGVTMDELRDAAQEGEQSLAAYCLPLDAPLSGWPEVSLTSDMVFYVRQGQAVQIARAPASGYLRMYSREGRFIGVGQIQDDGKVAPKRLLKQ